MNIFLFLAILIWGYGENIVDGKRLKILVHSPNMGYSHVQFQGKIADELVDAGHEVHFLISMWQIDSFYNGTEKSQKIIRFFTETPINLKETQIMKNPFNSNKASDTKMWDEFANMGNQFCLEMTQNSSWLIPELELENYDVGISEVYDACIFGIFEKIRIRTKIITSAIPLTEGLAEIFGIPIPRAYIPISMTSPISAPDFSYWEKAKNLYDSYNLIKFPYYSIEKINMYLKNSFGQDFPDAIDIIRKSSFVFVNIPEFLDMLKPISNKIIHIGGIALKKPKELDKKIGEIFEKTKKGVVLFSFGSIADPDLMPKNLRIAYITAFSKFPDYDFIWKYNLHDNDTDLISNIPNIHPNKWVDQNSILAEPKTKAFMTHCGLNSLIEGSFNGIPMVATPLFADQNYNAAIIKKKEIGVYLDLEKVTAQTVIQSLFEVLESEKYYNNAQKLKKKLSSFPYKPNEKLIKYVEYAADNLIEDELNLPGANMTFIEYFCLDIIIPVILLAFISVYVSSKVLYHLVLYFYSLKIKAKFE